MPPTQSPAVDFRVLGPLEVYRDGRALPVGGPKDRVILGLLALHANTVVPVDRLVAALWTVPPASARKNVQTHIWALRRLLGGVDGDGRIDSTPDGYRLRAADGELDADRFESLVAAGQRELAAGDPQSAAQRLREALALWRGPLLGDLPLPDTEQAAVVRLAERRMGALEDRIEADLRQGHHDQVVGELRALVSEEPLRERLRAQLMLALYRGGRQIEALAAFDAARHTLREELGLDPGPMLTRMQENILRRNPALDLAPATTAFPINQLPPDVADFTGRADAYEALSAALGGKGPTVRVAAVVGAAGVGKTALAVHVAHDLSDAFPDGQLYVTLHGAGRPPAPVESALGGFLRALGVPSERMPPTVAEQAALYRSLTAGKRYLVLLDDAADESQVRPLLPAGGGCAVLVTSRQRLLGLAAAATVPLDVLPSDEARRLLARIVGAQRVATEPGSAAEIVRLCGHLPLALRIAGARLAARPAWPLDRLVRRLTDERERLAELAAGDLEVHSAFESSYRALPEPQQAMFRALGRLDGADFDAVRAAELAGVTRPEAERLLDRLVDTHLVQLGAADDGYRLHDLVRLFARQHA